MTRVSNYQDDHGFELIALGIGEESPMENHLGGEVAVDAEAKRFYIHEVFLIGMGLDSIAKACRTYHELHAA